MILNNPCPEIAYVGPDTYYSYWSWNVPISDYTIKLRVPIRTDYDTGKRTVQFEVWKGDKFIGLLYYNGIVGLTIKSNTINVSFDVSYIIPEKYHPVGDPYCGNAQYTGNPGSSDSRHIWVTWDHIEVPDTDPVSIETTLNWSAKYNMKETVSYNITLGEWYSLRIPSFGCVGTSECREGCNSTGITIYKGENVLYGPLLFGFLVPPYCTWGYRSDLVSTGKELLKGFSCSYDTSTEDCYNILSSDGISTFEMCGASGYLLYKPSISIKLPPEIVMSIKWPEQVVIGEVCRVEVNVKNAGFSSDLFDLRLTEDGTEVDTYSVNLMPFSNRDVTLFYKPTEFGDHILCVERKE